MKSTGKLHNLNAWERKAASATSLVVPAGVDGLDELLPCGGWPKSGLVEIIVPGDYVDFMSLLMPALARFSRQGRWIAMVAPPCQARARLFTDTGVDPVKVLQVNPHPGRSALWTAESMLQSGNCSVVLAWPNCNTELMDKRLQNAAASGKALAILVRYEGLSMQPSAVDVRLKLETCADGSAVYLVDSQGEILSGMALP
ncbi:MAG: DNA lesion error-prone repair protein ImuA [Gammaproteobacteria bacterium]|jgi:cell division inhibitor SulA|nr:DNA lesion error-prone repair protein ImuA [Gammaproteobacteria bacterium]